MFGEEGGVVYVGKAKSLKRRLAQYKNAKRVKAHRKMKSIIKDALKIEWEVCASETDAFLREAELIQKLRPKWNVAGAFSFLYPMIGLAKENGNFVLCLTTLPKEFPDFDFHGAYRSRGMTRDAFFSLVKLLHYIGHPVPKRELQKWEGRKYSYLYGFRQIPDEWTEGWNAFFKGESFELMEQLALALLENAGARAKATTIQDHLNDLKRFWRHEAKRLLRAREKVGFVPYPVSQEERDMLFIRYRAAWK